MVALSKTQKQQDDAQTVRLWTVATIAAAGMPRDRKAYLLRWLVARTYNGFTPQPGQVPTKERVAHYAGEVCGALGLDMMAPPDRTLEDDAAYQAALDACLLLDHGQRRCLIEWLVKLELPYDREARMNAMTLCMNLRDMEHQRVANSGGWKEGGRRSRKKGRKR